MPEESVQCVVTSPPYWGLRNYGKEEQLGLEKTPEEYVSNMVDVFSEIKRVLKNDGTVWLNLGDTYNANYRGGGVDTASKKQASNKGTIDFMAKKKIKVDGIKPKDLVGIPWMVAFALRADGWYLRSDIIWEKPNCMPESVKDRPTRSHEYLFLLTKNGKYNYDLDAIREPYESSPSTQKVRDKHKEGYQADFTKGDRFSPGARNYYTKGGRNKRTVWRVSTKPFKGAHFATFPPELITPCILAGCPVGETVLDPFGGSGTVSMVAEQLGRASIYVDLNEKYREMAIERLKSANIDAEYVAI